MTIARKSFSGTAVPTTLNGGISNVQTTATLAISTGWPDGTNGRTPAIIDPGLPTEENVTYLTRAGVGLTGMLRGQNGTVASAHANGAVILHGWSAGEADEAYQHLSDAEADPHAAKLLNVARHDLTARHPGGTVVPVGNPVASAPGDTMSIGTGTPLALATHRHAREAAAGGVVFGVPGASAPSDTADIGSGGLVAQSNHRHSREAAPVMTFGALTAWTPSWTGSVSNPTPSGTPFASSRFLIAGTLAFLHFNLSFVAGGGIGSGIYTFGYPPGVTPVRSTAMGCKVDIAGFGDLAGYVYCSLAGINFFCPNGSTSGADPVSSSFPAAFAVGSSLEFTGWIPLT